MVDTIHHTAKPIELQCVANFRDVGQTVNEYLGQKRVREGFIFRSARPDGASVRDTEIIRDELGMKTIIDLRTKTELIKQAEKISTENTSSSWFSSRPRLPHIKGINYEEIKITGRPFERHLLGQLSWWNFMYVPKNIYKGAISSDGVNSRDRSKVIVLFIFGYRIAAVRLIATEVMLPRGLLGLGIDTVDHSGAEICEALQLYASSGRLPILVHCTQGKDRTGIPLDAIEHDYFLTDSALEAERQERLLEIREIGLTDEWATTAPDMVIGMQKHLDVVHGGLESYLDGIGFDASSRARLRELLLY